METIVYHAKIVTYKINPGGYTVFAFENIDSPGEYGICTLLPNWDIPTLQIGDKGYIRCREVYAGRDSWYNIIDKKFVPYRYDGIYMEDFIPEKKDIKSIIL